MYLDYYSMIEEPFSVTADPKYLYLSEGHEEAQAHLLYAIRKQRGFVCITGGVGTGKTMLLNSMLTTLDKGYTFAFIYQSAVDTLELLRYIFKEYGIEDKGYSTKSEYLSALNDFLLEELAQDRNVVLMIDEAQNLSVPVLEDLRLISNLETSKKKLIQIVLAGQSELKEMLLLPELRQLNQRIALRYHLGYISESETAEYIWHRLKIAGCPRDDLFENRAVHEIYQFTRGTPRLINQVCDTSLLKGFLSKKPVITAEAVQDVIATEFSHRQVETSFEGNEETGREAAVVTEPPIASPPPQTASQHVVKAATAKRKPRVGVWVAVTVVVVLVGFATWRIWIQQPEFGFTPASQEEIADSDIESDKPASSDAAQSDLIAGALEEQEETTFVTEAEAKPVSQPVTEMVEDQQQLADHEPPVIEQEEQTAVRKTTAREEVVHEPGGKVLRIRRGDRLFVLMWNEYGCVTEPVLERVLEANQHIRNPNIIRVGDFLYLPKLAESDLEAWRMLPSLM